MNYRAVSHYDSFLLGYEQIRLKVHSTGMRSVSAPWGLRKLCRDTCCERRHDRSLVLVPVREVVFGNSMLMTAPGVGGARTLWLKRHVCASAKRRASFENAFTTAFLFPSHLLSLCTSLPVHNFRQVFIFHKLVTIGHNSLFHLAVPLCCTKPSSSIITSALS